MLRTLLFAVLLAGGGWIVGSIYPAPAALTAPVARHVGVAARLGLDRVSIDALRNVLSDAELEALQRDASVLAARAGNAIVIERDDSHLQEIMAALPAPASTPELTASRSNFESNLSLCPGMNVSNAPPADAQRRVRNYVNTVEVQGVALAVNPSRGACLSSSFGPRGRGRHNGVDYHAAQGGPILAAGDGIVREAKYRNDYGNMLVIDHGSGVFTRYAHLSSFNEGVVEGASVSAGQPIGLMGNTASYPIPIHLHYEILVGDYDTPAGAFGLAPVSPFAP